MSADHLPDFGCVDDDHGTCTPAMMKPLALRLVSARLDGNHLGLGAAVAEATWLHGTGCAISLMDALTKIAVQALRMWESHAPDHPDVAAFITARLAKALDDEASGAGAS